MTDYSYYPVDLADVMADLGIDELDDLIKNRLDRLIKLSHSYLIGAIGEDYPVHDARSKEIALIVINDLYDNRITTEPRITSKARLLVQSLEHQLRLELRSVKNE